MTATERGHDPKPAAKLSVGQVLAWRMRRQLLHPVGSLGVLDTVEAMVGAQAQVQSSAELGIALRRRNATVGEAAAAIADRTLMRTWAMRGTLHLLEPVQGRALLALLATSRRWELPSWQKWYVGPAELELLIETVRETLDGRVLGRDELIEEIAERTGNRELDEHLRSGWGGLLKPMAWMGHLCNGPSRGGRVTFTRPDSWFESWPGLPSVQEAARIAIPAYLRAYGPATSRAFHAWLAREACSVRDVKSWFELTADRVVTVTVAGEPCLALAEDVEELKATRPSRTVRLVAGFDQYLLGPGTSDERIISPQRRTAVSRAAGWISPSVLVGGRVAGVWRLDDDAMSVEIFGEEREVPRSALESEAARVSKSLGRDLKLTVSRS
jgi:Winged helix DNA-binding domain